jgi:hypothetical protein
MALRADSSLGLFVVARLAAKLGITVTFDPSRYGGLRATVLIPTQHLAGNEQVDQINDAELASLEDTAVLAPVGGPAMRAEESSPHLSSPAGQIPMKRDAKPSPYPARELTPPDPVPVARPAVTERTYPSGPAEPPAERRDDRPRLPRREPQQNLVAQLREEPDDDQNDEVVGEGPARALTAFHKGTRRGRNGAEDS